VVYSLASGDMSGTYDMQNVEFSMPEGGFMAWKGFSGTFDMQKVLPMLYVGLNKAFVGGMEMSFPSPETGELEVVKMEKLEMTSNSTYDGKMVHFEQNATFGGLYIEGEKYGPLTINAEMKNIDGQALSDYQQQVIGVYKDVSSLDPDAIVARMLPMYVDLFSKLLVGDPELNIREFSLVTSKGDAEGSLNLRVAGIEEVSFENPIMLLQYLQNIDASADLSIDESLVRAIVLQKAKSDINEQIADAGAQGQELGFTDEQIEEMALQQYELQLEMLVAQNYIVQEVDKLRHSHEGVPRKCPQLYWRPSAPDCILPPMR
jgi:uncharacterized protein YdgA (DUF945 family)